MRKFNWRICGLCFKIEYYVGALGDGSVGSSSKLIYLVKFYLSIQLCSHQLWFWGFWYRRQVVVLSK